MTFNNMIANWPQKCFNTFGQVVQSPPVCISTSGQTNADRLEPDREPL